MAGPTTGRPRLIRLHLQLRYVTDPIWRQLLIPGDLTLWHLHRAILVLMGWDGFHLHSFTIGKRRYEPEEYDGFFADDNPPVDDATVAIGDVLKRKGQKLFYIYDFGDSWEIDGVVEAVLPPDPNVTAPVCLDGQRAGPLEDSGGAWGYQSLVESVRARNAGDVSEEDDSDWFLDESFNPEAFDREAVNEALAKLLEPIEDLDADEDEDGESDRPGEDNDDAPR